MSDLFRLWGDVTGRMTRAARVFLFFDFDGTLAPVAPRPEMAALDEKTRESLRRLSKKQAWTVSIVSGRGLEDLRKMVGVEDIVFVGNHGFEVKGPGLEYVHPGAMACRPAVENVLKILEQDLREIQGVFIEDKVYSLSVHYRQCAPGNIPRVGEIVEQASQQSCANNHVRVTPGKKVFEIRPLADWHKGRVIEWLLDRWIEDPAQESIAWYVGDDQTDEDAFKAVKKRGGITVLVGAGNPQSAAQYTLTSQNGMQELLSRLESAWTH